MALSVIISNSASSSSFIEFSIASPLSGGHINKALVARTRPPLTAESKPISRQGYESYLRKYFPRTDRYLFFSGDLEHDQVIPFLGKNPDYYYFSTLFNAATLDHLWYKEFDEEKEQDDADAASKAMANLVSGPVLVFGAIEYQTAGMNSFFATKEIRRLREGIRADGIIAIHHMAKGATDPSQVMAIEDADKNVVWQPAYTKGTKNASGLYGNCQSLKRGVGCDEPVIKPKSRCGSKGKRAAALNEACPMRKPTKKTPSKDVTKKPSKNKTKNPAKHTPKKPAKHATKKLKTHATKRPAKHTTKRPSRHTTKSDLNHTRKKASRHGRGWARTA